MISLQTGIKRKDKINSIIGYSGKIIDSEHLGKNIVSRPNIILMHGDIDQVVPIDSLLEAKNFFNENYNIVSIEQADKSTPLENFSLDSGKKYAVIFGNEIKGVSQSVIDLSDDVVEITQYGTKHSLNVSVSAGIVVWDFFLKINAN